MYVMFLIKREEKKKVESGRTERGGQKQYTLHEDEYYYD